jgi:hypothetical protein
MDRKPTCSSVGRRPHRGLDLQDQQVRWEPAQLHRPRWKYPTRPKMSYTYGKLVASSKWDGSLLEKPLPLWICKDYSFPPSNPILALTEIEAVLIGMGNIDF